MNIALFVLVLMTSFIAVRIGAIAFEVTGLEWSMARFQALSCFSGTGFTTKESELISGHPRRRQIASILMVLGNAGLVTLIATFANSLRPDAVVITLFTESLGRIFPMWLAHILNVALLATIILVIVRVFTHERFARRLTRFLRSRMRPDEGVSRVSFEELVVATGGYGVSAIEVHEGGWIVGKNLLESGLRAVDVTVLSIERGREVFPNPRPDLIIDAGDKLICFGRLDKMREKFMSED